MTQPYKRMKMVKGDYDRLAADIVTRLAAHNYTAADVHSVGHAWDAFHAARGNWCYAAGYNDNHIETALKRMFSLKGRA